jgi:hypothetical protein
MYVQYGFLFLFDTDQVQIYQCGTYKITPPISTSPTFLGILAFRRSLSPLGGNFSLDFPNQIPGSNVG